MLGDIVLADVIGPAIVASGIFWHIGRRAWNTATMRQSISVMLCDELLDNIGALRNYRQNNSQYELEFSTDVYRGLLMSGNIRYLSSHQSRLHHLYRVMKNNDNDALELLTSVLYEIRVPAKNRILWWHWLSSRTRRLCSRIATRLGSLRRNSRAKSAA